MHKKCVAGRSSGLEHALHFISWKVRALWTTAPSEADEGMGSRQCTVRAWAWRGTREHTHVVLRSSISVRIRSVSSSYCLIWRAS